MFAASKSGSPAEATDAQFNYVTMLLHGDGTNGAQNNTFVDSSTNNFTITRNGNTTQGTFTPYGSNWSNYFDGTGDYLTVPDNAVLDMGSSDFTIEGWVFLSSTGSSQTFVAKGTGAGNQASYHIVFNGTNWLYYLSGNGSTWSIASGITMGAGTANTWQHLALVRSGSTFTPYVNGTAGTTTSSATALFDSTNVFSIGADDAFNQRITGYISNCRVVKGTAVYTSAFTPSTTPLTAITNTQLLTCQSNRFIDNSSNAFTVTKAGDVSVQRFSPFSPTSAYSTSVIGGSAYLDGSGDYLTVADNAALDFAADFTFECWVYSAASNSSSIFEGYQSGFSLGFDGGTIKVNQSYVAVLLSDTAVMQLNSWHHIAVSRSGTTLSLFRDGVRTATATNSTSFNTNTLNYIGQNGSSVYFSGYISNLRVVKGTAVYDPTQTTLTVPTAPLTAITNTSLLLNYTNAGIIDNAMMNDLETVGNAQISTSVKKYGTGSMYFDGNGDNLSGPTTPDLNMGTGNWTIECWVYISSRTLNYPLIFGNNNGSYTTGALALVNSNSDSASYNDRFCLSVKDIMNSPTLVASSTNSSNTWYHLAVVRNGTSLVMYRDGTSVASATISSGIVFDWGKLGSRIGGGNWDGAQSYFNGYIDDLRITKGVARYTANFTAPTAAFADKG